MKKTFATLRALVEVMEALSKDADPDVGRHIKEEVQVQWCIRYYFTISSSLLVNIPKLSQIIVCCPYYVLLKVEARSSDSFLRLLSHTHINT